MTIKDMRDIDRERRERERAELKENITEDIDDVMKDLFGRFKNESNKRKREKKKNEGLFIKILKLLGIVSLGLLIINFLLFNIIEILFQIFFLIPIGEYY